MARNKINLSNTCRAAPEEIYLVVKKGYKIYPININYKWFIAVDYKGKTERFEKEVKADDLNCALAKTVKYYYNQIVNI